MQRFTFHFSLVLLLALTGISSVESRDSKHFNSWPPGSLFQVALNDALSPARDKVQQLISAKRFAEAEEELRKILNTHPENREFERLYARILRFNEKFEQANDINTRLMEEFPRDMDLRVERALCWIGLQKFNLARKEINYILERHADHSDALFAQRVLNRAESYQRQQAGQSEGRGHRARTLEQAREHEMNKRFDEAVNLYQSLLADHPDDVEVILRLAQVLSWQKKFPEAQSLYRKARQLSPDLADGNLGLLRIKAWKGEHFEAEKGLLDLHAKHPDRLDILNLLGQVTAWQGKFQDSVDFYQKALKLYPDNQESLLGLATTYQWMKKTEEGIAVYSKILEKDPNNVQAIMGIGILYSHEGKHKQAITYLEQARELAPERQDIRAMLGTLYSWTARLDDAVTEFQKSLALERGDVSSYIALGRVYSWQKKNDESIKLYKKALELDPDNTEVLLGLGRTYLYNDEWDRAEKLFQRALKIQPGDPEIKKEIERLRKIKAPQLTTRYNFFEFKDSNPNTGNFDAVFRDNRETVEYFHKLSAKTTLQARYQRSDQEQIDKVNNVTDFKVDANIGSVGLTQKFPEDFGLRFRYDFSRFSDDGNNVFNLGGSETGHSGFFILSKEYGRHYWTASFGRELFIGTNTGKASVESINTYSISYDVDLTDHFSVLMAPSLDDFSTPLGTRQDHIFRPRYRLSFYDKIQLEYQFRYLSNPNDYENSFFVNFQNQLKDKLRYEIEYVLSHDTFDDALEHLTKLFLTWDIARWISWTVDARFGIEHINDDDITQSYQTYFTVRF